MSAHDYRITLEYLGGKHADSDRHAPLQFQTGNHDDLFDIIARVQGAGLTTPDEAAALALGLKLFSEVMLKHRKDPLFAALVPAFADFMTALKQRVRDAQEGQGGQAAALA